MRKNFGRGLVGLLLVASLHGHAAGAAQRRVPLDDRAALHDGFARLVFSGMGSGAAVPFTASAAGSRLRLHFARPVKFPLGPLRDGLRGYATGVALSPDGRSLTAHLERPVRLRQFTADAGRLVVDLMSIDVQDRQQEVSTAGPVAAAKGSASLDEALAALHSGQSARALPMLRRLAEQGNAAAQTTLGLIYLYGRIVPKDGVQAVNWLRKAADQGNALAEDSLGVTYEIGGPVPRDYARAVGWFRKAADAGNAHAQGNLGTMYQNGWGVPKDDAAAEKLYRLAAEQGDPDAQADLGILYQGGLGVTPDYTEAAKWYLRAAYRGIAKAQYNLALMYQAGQGVPKNAVQAYMWFALASRSPGLPPNLAASHRDAVAAAMNADELQQARREVAEWVTPAAGGGE